MENDMPLKIEKKGLRKMIMSGAGLSVIFIGLMISASVGVLALYEVLVSMGL